MSKPDDCYHRLEFGCEGEEVCYCQEAESWADQVGSNVPGWPATSRTTSGSTAARQIIISVIVLWALIMLPFALR